MFNIIQEKNGGDKKKWVNTKTAKKHIPNPRRTPC